MNKIKYLLPVKIPSASLVSDPEHPSSSDLFLPPEEAEKAQIAILGIPLETGLRYIGARGGPRGFRSGFSYVKSYSLELGVDIAEILKIVDLGDIDTFYVSIEEAFRRIDHVLSEVLKMGLTPIIAGGDHVITYPTVKTFCNHVKGNVGLIWFDSHFDVNPSFHGTQYYTGSPLIRILELENQPVKPENVAHIGAHGFENSKRSTEFVKKMGINTMTFEEIESKGIVPIMEKAIEIAKDGTEAFYVTFDIDIIEGAIVRGQPSPHVGGLMPPQMFKACRMVGLAGASAFDVVELTPPNDPQDVTMKIAADCALEFMGGLAKRRIS